MANSNGNRGGLALLALLSCVGGTITGVVVALFRITLQNADRWRDAWIMRTHGWPVPGFLLTVGVVAALAAFATWLVERISPHAAGSGLHWAGKAPACK